MHTIVKPLLARLVAFDTTSRHSNLSLIEWLCDYLSGLGIDSSLSYNQDRSKANLFARIGPEGMDTLVLSGHSDVVPVDGQDWSVAPFVLTERDGRYHGRGSADMKGFIACVLAWLPSVLEAARAGRLQQAVALAVSYDEELGCLGVPRLIEGIQASGVRVSGCIVGEPTTMLPVIAHKGIAHFRCRVQGRAAHSSLTPQGVNAIEYAAKLIGYIRQLAEAEACACRSPSLYDVPFATLQTGTIQGGTVPNIVPRDCEFVFECRWLPGELLDRYIAPVRACAEALLTEMRTVAPEAAISITQLIDCQPFESPSQGPLMALIDTLCPGRAKQAVAYTTEAGCFSAAGFPSVVLGPGSIAQAHKPDEYIEITQLDACSQWLNQLLAVIGQAH